jgi:hypothetical protein
MDGNIAIIDCDEVAKGDLKWMDYTINGIRNFKVAKV